MRWLFGALMMGLLVSSLFEVAYWQGYHSAPEAQKREYWAETQLERNCKQDYVTNPPHLQGDAVALAEWQDKLSVSQAMHCRDYEAHMQKSELQKNIDFVWANSSSLIILAVLLLGAWGYYTMTKAPSRRRY